MKLFFAAAAALLVTTSANAVNLLTNGGFEDPVIGNSCCSTVVMPNSFPGWTVTAGDINVVNGTYSSSPSGTNLAYEANQYLDLIGESNAGEITQTFNTIAGQAYQLTFAYSHNLFGGLGMAEAAFSVGDLAGTISHSSGNNANLDWRLFSGSFVAGLGTTSTLTFTNLINGTNAGVFLDDVSVTSVPEVATWGMMIVGFGAMGAMARRRRQLPAYA